MCIEIFCWRWGEMQRCEQHNSSLAVVAGSHENRELKHPMRADRAFEVLGTAKTVSEDC